MQTQIQSGRLAKGAIIAGRELISVQGERIRIPDPDRLVHLQLRRFAGCPVCNLHLRSIILKHSEIVAAGIREVVGFHSNRDEWQKHAADLPFAVIADPNKRIYSEFGAESAATALLDCRRG